jgi:predicted nucleic acid-binding protein
MSGRRRLDQGAELPRIVLDTGALIALDQQRPVERMRILVATAAAAGRRLHIPAVVVAEWWRGDNLAHHRNAKMFKVEPVTEIIARSAGEALRISKDRRVTALLTIDAIVMATAASLGAVVYTSDFDDLDRFTRFFDARVLTM